MNSVSAPVLARRRSCGRSSAPRTQWGCACCSTWPPTISRTSRRIISMRNVAAGNLRTTPGSSVTPRDGRCITSTGRISNLNYANPAVRSYMLSAFAHWLRDYHVDGFRLDAAWAVRQRDPRFWPKLHAVLTRIDPNIVLIAEASGRDPYYVNHGFDAAYDCTSRLGQWAWD